MISPARTKKGRASNVKDSLVDTMDWKMTVSGNLPVNRPKRRGVSPMLNASGMAVADRPRKRPQITTKFTA